MDYILHYADELVLDRVYASLLPARSFLPSPTSLLANATTTTSSLLKHLPHPPIDASSVALAAASAWPRDYYLRQLLSLYSLTLLGISLMYFTVATASYYLIFNHDMMRHPRFLKGQVAMEIRSSCIAFPTITALTVPWFFAEVRGRGRYYEDISEYGVWYAVLTVPAFLLFTDTLIYWIHRWEHHPALYKHVHKPHHKWIIPTPFASHAFHPLDGYAQSLPYHMFGALFPFHKGLYLALFSAVNIWSIFIHDSDMVTGSRFEKIINGPAHHTLHHLYFTCNYGQYFTLSDRLGSSYRQPVSEHDPMIEVRRVMAAEKEKKAE